MRSGFLESSPDPRAWSTLGPMLEVTSGLRCGAIVLLDNPKSFIGCSLSADLTLRDAGVASKHAALHVGRRRIRIEAIGGDIGLQRRRLAKGHACYLQPPVDIVLGAATVRLSQPNRTTPRGARATQALQAVSPRIAATVGIGIVSAIALSLIGGAMAFSIKTTILAANGESPTQLAANADTPVTAPSEAVASVMAKDKPAPAQPPRMDHVARDVSADLDAAGPDAFRMTAIDARWMLTARAQFADQPPEQDSGDLQSWQFAETQDDPARDDRSVSQLQSARQARAGQADCERTTYRATEYEGYPCKRGSETVGPERVERDRRPEDIRTGIEQFWRSRSASRRGGSASPPSRFDMWPLIAALPPVSLRPPSLPPAYE